MIDIKILVIRDILPISTVELANGVSPLSLIITGDHLDQADQVLINDIEATEFAVLSSNRLLVKIPSSELSGSIRKVVVIATIPSTNRRSALHFEVGSSLKSIKGLEKLIQAFCKLLIQTPGSDRFRPDEGGGLLKLVGRSVSKGGVNNLQASIVGAVSRTRDQFLARQGSNSRIPSDERLLTVITESVGFDPSTTTLSARISLSAVSGKLAVANLTL